ncbi:UDP-2,3-diacylglucosamine hydrolase [Flavipsychrobacter stenotrophus]|uniref:UDP-2,3-diacylglucosamine hydrolase n=1 Tax=Flavipsychrobacter stenotrophus TaxID=2077091 RepID=A0A2S7SY08_9BACT|nr:UDP-2,3-diacylglucosamine diphosphatase [Flavipsychrobacter stenotrophus]PQJ11588.1 UDP-2,3-diacylglucosamine hydrolase [Flavipsychrobacter stenotrophus]
MAKRDVDILVLSDIHLGTYGCHAKELLQYLKTIRPKAVVLNGDIIDVWQFSKRYWPTTHMMVVKHLIGLIAKEVPVYYIPGNHDEMLRRFKGFQLGSLKITNKLSLKVNDSRVWIFHGDVFDVVMQHSRWLAKLGAVGYDTLILINSMINWVSQKMGRGKISLSKKVKNSVKGAVKFINKFEDTVCSIAAENKYDYVICGHIHHPEMKNVVTEHGSVMYLNSGDWIENLTALEYTGSEWTIYNYFQDPVAQEVDIDKKKQTKESAKAMMASLMLELNINSHSSKNEEGLDAA